MRDPAGASGYNGDWQSTDSKWTASTIASIPYLVDVTDTATKNKGYFVVPIEKFTNNANAALRCLPYVQFGINKAGYKSYRYDAEVDKAATATAGTVKYSPDLTST